MMISVINSSLQAAVDLVAPPCARLEDLKYHWQQVLQECQKAQESGEKRLIVSEETHAPRHLKQMLRILMNDATSSHDAIQLSSCMEYIIQERILVTLSSFAWADRPLGIRQYSYMFLSKALSHLHHSYLHQMRIHKPLQTLIKATCEKKASPYENQEIEFLSMICSKIKEDPSIILLYIEPLTLASEMPTGFTPDISGSSTPTNREQEIGATSESLLHLGSKFPLVEALLNLCHSNDAQICTRAHDCLQLITSLKEARSAEAMAKHTLLSHYIASRLTTAAEAIPYDIEPSFIENVDHAERDNLSDDEEGNEGATTVRDFDGKKELCEFLRWLQFFDKLISGCDCFLATSICSIVRELFFEGYIGAQLMNEKASDDTVSLYVSLLTKMLLSMTSSILVNCCIMWLTEDFEESPGKDKDNISLCLLRRCTLPPSHLQIQTLRLLQVMMEKPGCLAVQILAINYVSSRCYFDSSMAEHQQNSWSDEEDERYKMRDDKDMTPGTIPVSRTLAPTNISKIVKTFLSVVPEELRSANLEDFESYKADALRQYRDVCRRAPYHTWPREAIGRESSSQCSSSSSKESGPEVDRQYGHEGPLLETLLDLLASLPVQDYDVNLQTTSIVSSLALVPHPHLHELLLNPTISLSQGTRTPYTIMKSIVEQIRGPILARKDFRNYLKVTRFQLLGTMEDLDYERDEHDNKFEALIVIEEFAKELAAIAYAKYTCEGNLL